jgi:hypothetical protein
MIYSIFSNKRYVMILLYTLTFTELHYSRYEIDLPRQALLGGFEIIRHYIVYYIEITS